ncbi:MAG: DUF1501 domain-containing protein [Planctomycetes bacterium]|nr:DUF1501 domain-containing protein [Planctomycetota bacterium]
MLNLFPTLRKAGLATRRQWLQVAASAGLGLNLPGLLRAETAARLAPLSHPPTARNCIYIFLCGGPSQPDLWDLKPDAPAGIRSVFDPIETTVPGIRFGSLIPQIAQHADKLALIRSMTHTDNDHNGAIAHTLLGQLPARRGEPFVSRDDHPNLGAILHRLTGAVGDAPAWVVLPRPFTTYSPPHKGQSAGFLGPAFDPLTFNKETKGSLTAAPVKLESVQLPEGVDEARLRKRLTLAEALQADTHLAEASPTVRRMHDSYAKAVNLVATSQTNRAFDLSREPDRIRDRYGRNEYGQSFLMARRLVEAGVRTVNVFWTFFDTKGCQFNLWDNHGVPNDVCGIDGQMTGVQQLTHQYCTPSFDRSFSALLEDLHERGLLDETLVVVAGEFGRTPKINATNGRDHWAPCYTQLLAGGGIRGGQVYGASDRQGAYVKDSPVTPDDFAATILHAFGLSPEMAIEDPQGRPVRISTGTPVTALF